MLKWLRVAGIAFVDLLIAVMGTTIIDSEIHGRAYDRAKMILIEDIRSAVIAFALGFVVYYLCRNRSSRWVWVAGVIWFAQRSLIYWSSQRDLRAVLHSGHSVYWEMSGAGAAANLDIQSMGDWAGYTLPLLRTVFYSLGAFLCAYLFQRGWAGWPILSSVRVRSPFGQKGNATE